MFQPFRIKNGTWLQYCFVGSKLNEDLTILYQTANQMDVLFQRFWKFHPIRMNFPCRPCFSPNQKEMMNLCLCRAWFQSVSYFQRRFGKRHPWFRITNCPWRQCICRIKMKGVISVENTTNTIPATFDPNWLSTFRKYYFLKDSAYQKQ